MFSKLEQYLEMIRVEENIPACDCIVYHRHNVVFRHMVGYSDASKTKPVSEKDRYILYSATKPITITAAMQLVERGIIRLEDEIYKYLPEFEYMYVGEKPADNKITVEHLLSMRGGFNYNLNGKGIREVIDKNPNASLKDIVTGIAKQPLRFEPGTRFRYSLCHDILGRLIEAVSNMTLGEYMKRHIFEPLGMRDTGFSIEDALPNLTEQYALDGESNEVKVVEPMNPYRLTPCYESGGAGLVSTVADYGKFVDAMCNCGISSSGVRLLSKGSIDLMRFRTVDEVCQTDFQKSLGLQGYGYGLGVRTMVDRTASGSKGPIGEFGWDGAAGSYVLIDVENKIGIFYAQQIRGKGMIQIHSRIRDLVYEALENK